MIRVIIVIDLVGDHMDRMVIKKQKVPIIRSCSFETMVELICFTAEVPKVGVHFDLQVGKTL